MVGRQYCSRDATAFIVSIKDAPPVPPSARDGGGFWSIERGSSIKLAPMAHPRPSAPASQILMMQPVATCSSVDEALERLGMAVEPGIQTLSQWLCSEEFTPNEAYHL